MGCPPRVQAALDSVDGVENTKINFADKTATVTCNPGTDETAMLAALEESGFGGAVKK